LSSGGPIFDPRQLERIESVHRGLLYQHLYAAGCLLCAPGAGVITAHVERDEDVEVTLPDQRTSTSRCPVWRPTSGRRSRRRWACPFRSSPKC